MQEYGTERITPNKQNRQGPAQDGRPQRRDVRRGKIGRLVTWRFNFRQLVVRYEQAAKNLQGFLYWAAAFILLRCL